MKKIYAFFCSFPIALLAIAQPVPLTFQVDMSQEIISPLGVHIAGDFQQPAGLGNNWNPGSTVMSDSNGDKIYDITVQVPPGAYQYKFVNGNAWGMDENPPADCSVGATFNRVVTVGTGGLSLAPVVFNACNTSIDTNYAVHWWNDAVFYEIFVRSFFDSNADGIGDFQGIIQKLDYLNDGDPNTNTDLGITGIWLMPMMASPSYHGYDVTDYYAVEPDYGTMADFEALLDAAHARGIKVIIDFVMNHTSSQHPWFTQSAAGQNGFRDWYIWSNTNPGFTGPWGQTVWHKNGSDYYYGLFWSGMPDLNYENPLVKNEMFNAAAFWLDKGVDGFRLDAIKYLDEDGTVLENTPETFQILEELHNLYKAANPEGFAVGEAWSNTTAVVPYVSNNRLDACFEFDLAYALIDAVNNNNPAGVRQKVSLMQQVYPALQYATFLTNHDIDRVFGAFGSDVAKMKQAASLYLSLPGVPFVYYGEEIGLTGAGADENKRKPMHWTGGLYAGFSTVTPWNSPGGNLLTNNVAGMTGNPNSLLSHYRNWIHARNGNNALRRGYLLNVQTSNNQTLGFVRIYAHEAALVVSQFAQNAGNLTLSLPASTLPEGAYEVVDLITQEQLGAIAIDSKGSFTDWAWPGTAPAFRETRLLGLSLVTSSVQQPSSESFIQVGISPNPVESRARIQLTWIDSDAENSLSVYNVEGKMRFQTTFFGGSLELNTSEWPAGIYMLQVTSGPKKGGAVLVKE